MTPCIARFFLRPPFSPGVLRSILATLFLAPLSPVGRAAPSGSVYSPRDYGAAGTGTTLDTAAFQRSLDAAQAAGGGVVHVDAGTYLIGTIHLPSGVTLDLAEGATLKGSPHIADYRRGNWPALILARSQTHVAITGRGTIDGQGTLVAQDTVRIYESGQYVDFFPGLKPGEKVFTGIGTDKNPSIDPFAMQAAGTLAERVAPRSREDVATWRVDEFVRPQLIEFLQCRDVRVTGVTLKNAANWVQTYRDCEDVAISQLHVVSTSYWNNDGLDIVNCRRVRIEDCDINSADDGICLKSDPASEGHGCEDVSISRCRIRSSASALKLGTASHVAFRRIRAEDLEIYDTYRSAVALEAVDGGVIDDVKVSRIRARNTGNAFFLRIGQRNESRPPGHLRNVELSDMEVEIPSGRPDAGYEHPGPPLKVATNLIPSSIVGLTDRPVENVVLRNITLVYGGGGKREHAQVPLSNLTSIPERRANYPEFSMFGELPAWGLFIRDAKNVRLENVSFRLAKPDFRSAIVVHRAQNLTLNRVGIASAGEEPALVLAEVEGEHLEKISWPTSDTDQRVRRLSAPPR